jgi:hypothetical protein
MRTRSLAIALFGVLAMAKPAHAGWLDVIWEMSGPRMLGMRVLAIEVGLGRPVSPNVVRADASRRLLGPVWKPKPSFVDLASEYRWWLMTEMYAYGSTEKTVDTVPLGRVWMLAIDPMLAYGRRLENGARVYTAYGFSFNRLFGPDIHPAGNWAIKLRPLAVDRTFGWLTLGADYSWRIYPGGFDVGANPPSLTRGTKTEIVHGPSLEIGFIFRP